jgi:hypothetical protein
MNKINFCPSCGKKIKRMNASQLNFCCFCGAKLRRDNKPLKLTSQCPICHEYVSLKKNTSIECSFCGSKYHSPCITAWLAKYNSCPLCLNMFLMPKIMSVETSR